MQSLFDHAAVQALPARLRDDMYQNEQKRLENIFGLVGDLVSKLPDHASVTERNAELTDAAVWSGYIDMCETVSCLPAHRCLKHLLCSVDLFSFNALLA
jgi:hypothetical protein